MTSQQLQRWADSAALKVLTYAVTSIAFPVSGYIGVRVLNELQELRTLIVVSDKQAALMEQRLRAAELKLEERGPVLSGMKEQLLRHDIELQQLKDARERR